MDFSSTMLVGRPYSKVTTMSSTTSRLLFQDRVMLANRGSGYLDQLRRVRQVGAGRITLIAAQVIPGGSTLICITSFMLAGVDLRARPRLRAPQRPAHLKLPAGLRPAGGQQDDEVETGVKVEEESVNGWAGAGQVEEAEMCGGLGPPHILVLDQVKKVELCGGHGPGP
ncbi:hypothetical protein EYF80_033978 [Liparis tanakae]|uniref:Uncharacterized protein n=1 Tax=Liparis tanakae TaxID=230148 RepID=A0A4Z2GQR6_9TELE|nr:hypothetical protein EYF80_033978 [Liparis tanakae]